MRTFSHICFLIWAQCFTHGFQTLMFTHGSYYMFSLLLSISDISLWMSQSHWNTSSIFILHPLYIIFSLILWNGLLTIRGFLSFHTKTWLLMQIAQRGYEILHLHHYDQIFLLNLQCKSIGTFNLYDFIFSFLHPVVVLVWIRGWSSSNLKSEEIQASLKTNSSWKCAA